MSKVTAYEIENHGVQHHQFWQGTRTKLDDAFTGIGWTEKEAVRDAIENVCMTHKPGRLEDIDLSEYDGGYTVKDHVRDTVPEEDLDESDPTDGQWHYITIHVEVEQ